MLCYKYICCTNIRCINILCINMRCINPLYKYIRCISICCINIRCINIRCVIIRCIHIRCCKYPLYKGRGLVLRGHKSAEHGSQRADTPPRIGGRGPPLSQDGGGRHREARPRELQHRYHGLPGASNAGPSFIFRYNTAVIFLYSVIIRPLIIVIIRLLCSVIIYLL